MRHIQTELLVDNVENSQTTLTILTILCQSLIYPLGLLSFVHGIISKAMYDSYVGLGEMFQDLTGSCCEDLAHRDCWQGFVGDLETWISMEARNVVIRDSLITKVCQVDT